MKKKSRKHAFNTRTSIRFYNSWVCLNSVSRAFVVNVFNVDGWVYIYIWVCVYVYVDFGWVSLSELSFLHWHCIGLYIFLSLVQLTTIISYLPCLLPHINTQRSLTHTQYCPKSNRKSKLERGKKGRKHEYRFLTELESRL